MNICRLLARVDSMFTLCVFAVALNASARTVYVSSKGGGDGSEGSPTTLASALANARAEDDIVLETGNYSTSVQLTVGEAVTVRSASGRSEDVVITLTGTSANHLLVVANAGAVVSSITLQGGQDRADTAENGYGRNTYITAGVVSNCVIRGASLTSPGKGHWTTTVGLNGVDAVMTHCTVSNNVVTGTDQSSSSKDVTPGVFVASGRLSHTLVTRNVDTGRRYEGSGTMKDGGGVTLTGGSMDHCTVCLNEAPHVGGVCVKSPATVGKCVVFGNVSSYRVYDYDDIQPGTEVSFADSVVTDLNPWSEFAGYEKEDLRGVPGGALAAADAGYAFAGETDPYVGIRVSVLRTIVPDEITFWPSVVGIAGVVAYRWDFGDGSEPAVTAESSVTHVYAAKGSPTVTLTLLGAEDAELGRVTRRLALLSETVQAADYPSIQAAIDDAVPGCAVEIASGPHEIATVLRIEKGVRLRGETGNPEDVRLVSAVNGSAVFLNDRDARLEGVTVQDGAIANVYTDGAAVCVERRGGTVSNCVFRNFTFTGSIVAIQKQTGVYLAGPDALMTHCVVTNFGLTSRVGSSAALRCVPGVCLEADARLENSLIADIRSENSNEQRKWAAGVYASKGRLLNCTIVNNTSIADAGGVYLAAGSATNCVIAGNSSKQGDDYRNVNVNCKNKLFYCATDDAEPVSATSVKGSVSEFFRDFAGGDYTLTSGSPLKDNGVSAGKGVPAPAETDLAGNDRISGEEIDIGCYEFDVNAFTLNFSTPRTDLTLPATVTFTAQPSGFLETDEVWFYWDFENDGVTDRVTQEYSVTHTYETYGRVSVALAVTNKTSGVTGRSVRENYLHLVPTVMYVDARSASPAYPYGEPEQAATNVQDALDAALDGVTILVEAGTYPCTAQVSIAKGVTVRGATGNPEDVVFESVAGERNFYLNHGAARLESVVSQGRTLTGDAGKGEGRHLLVDTLGGIVSNCVFRGYNAKSVGTVGSSVSVNGIALKSANALLTHSVVTNNAISGNVGTSSPGAYSPGVVLNSNARIENSLVAYNLHSVTNSNYAFHRGYAAGICGDGLVVNCTVVSNLSVETGGINFRASNATEQDEITSGEIVNTVVAGNVCINPKYQEWMRAVSPQRECDDPDNATTKVRARSRNSVFGGDMADLFAAPDRGVFVPRVTGPLQSRGTQEGISVPALDLAGERRVVGRIDIGAYESVAGLLLMVR